MSNKPLKLSDMGIGQIAEPDRQPLSNTGALIILRFRVDTQTKWFEANNPDKQGILKFDATDENGTMVKYFTTSKIAHELFREICKTVATVSVKDVGVIWQTFTSPIQIEKIEMISTGVKGHNPYPKFY